ncbi:hypothetical protein O1611_g1989 [Lasiodiplodia mahajangana]|uniref:Uncharacterized protein n=1 Tax=Lasiodiplodia mahajangana TaxID=1108764 RepID=A0ACC2JVZ8_9PEZI|nr:hypothetical protein O1611_g1989 [Lasiodiplodia mahajangana]
MLELAEGFVVYDEAGEPVTPNANVDNDIGTASEEEEKRSAHKPASIESHALGPPEGSNAALFKKFFDSIVGMGKKHQIGENCHGRGIGSALLRSVLDLADHEGLLAYLESTRVGAPLYRRYGYKVIDTLEFDGAEAGFDIPAIL